MWRISKKTNLSSFLQFQVHRKTAPGMREREKEQSAQAKTAAHERMAMAEE
jgi:hypothetical protein